MKLSDNFQKVKNKIKPFEGDLIIVITIILVALISFGLGRFSSLKEEKTPITIENTTGSVFGAQGAGNSSVSEKSSAVPQGEKLFVASKSGTKYYYPWCSGVSRIKDENKVWFSSADEAQKAGYAPAANCKGL